MEAEAAKKARTQCLRNFTRSYNLFIEAHAKILPLDLVTKAFDKLQLCYDKLEAAQDEYAMVGDEEADDYLKDAGESYQTALVSYGELRKESVED